MLGPTRWNFGKLFTLFKWGLSLVESCPGLVCDKWVILADSHARVMWVFLILNECIYILFKQWFQYLAHGFIIFEPLFLRTNPVNLGAKVHQIPAKMGLRLATLAGTGFRRAVTCASGDLSQ